MTSNVNKDRLRMWVRALRSGQYQQGKNFLRKDNRYCCLGVAMDLALANGVKCDNPDWGKTALLPPQVIDWFGLDGGATGSRGLNDRLTRASNRMPSDMNDNGTSFNEIADQLELHYGLLEG